MTLKRLWELWNQFWFEERSPLPMAAYRILFSLHVLGFVLLMLPDLSNWYGSQGLITSAANKEWLITDRFSLFAWLPDTPWAIYGAFALLFITAITTGLGLFTRTSLLVLSLALFSIHHRNLIILNSGDLFMRLSAVYLLLSPAGNALSLDNLIRKKSGRSTPATSPIWAQRLLQLQLCTVYLQSSLAKLAGETWCDGTAIYYVGRLLDFQKLPVPWVFDNMFLIKLLTWGTLVVEFALWTLIWVKEFRYYILAAGILLHLGIEWSMNIPMFETQMICAYVVFVDPVDIQRFIDRIRSLFSRRPISLEKAVVAHDGL